MIVNDLMRKLESMALGDKVLLVVTKKYPSGRSVDITIQDVNDITFVLEDHPMKVDYDAISCVVTTPEPRAD